jgi:predicted metal-dependent phosphoesterase TrpH
MIDLHVHSTYSDGTLRPDELVALAVKTGLSALALTDHDGVDGVGPLQEACAALPPETPLTGVAGVEISAQVGRGTMHLLGYFVDPANEGLRAGLAKIRGGRRDRNERILKRLHTLGCPVEWEAVSGHAGGDVVGRLHFAMELVAKGFVKTRERAFSRFLAKGQAAYEERYRMPPAESIRFIVEAGGVAVLAHPSSLELTATALRRRLDELKRMGLHGVEVYYPLHAPEQQTQFAQIARDLDLVATGGSDFHGAGKSGLALGRGFGSLNVEDAVLDALAARRPSLA